MLVQNENLKWISFRMDYISWFSRILAFYAKYNQIMRAKYHKVFYPQNFISTKYQERNIKKKIDGRK